MCVRVLMLNVCLFGRLQFKVFRLNIAVHNITISKCTRECEWIHINRKIQYLACVLVCAAKWCYHYIISMIFFVLFCFALNFLAIRQNYTSCNAIWKKKKFLRNKSRFLEFNKYNHGYYYFLNFGLNFKP